MPISHAISAQYPNGALSIKAGAHFFAGFEIDSPFCVDDHHFPRTRISTRPALARSRREDTKAAKFNAPAVDQALRYRIEETVHDAIDLFHREVRMILSQALPRVRI